MIIGVDWASVDGDGDPDFATAKQHSSIAFAMHRATYGTEVDPRFKPDWQ
jgi:hypothetical protein